MSALVLTPRRLRPDAEGAAPSSFASAAAVAAALSAAVGLFGGSRAMTVAWKERVEGETSDRRAEAGELIAALRSMTGELVEMWMQSQGWPGALCLSNGRVTSEVLDCSQRLIEPQVSGT